MDPSNLAVEDRQAWTGPPAIPTQPSAQARLSRYQATPVFFCLLSHAECQLISSIVFSDFLRLGYAVELFRDEKSMRDELLERLAYIQEPNH